jgi:hypothetical protein
MSEGAFSTTARRDEEDLIDASMARRARVTGGEPCVSSWCNQTAGGTPHRCRGEAGTAQRSHGCVGPSQRAMFLPGLERLQIADFEKPWL